MLLQAEVYAYEKTGDDMKFEDGMTVTIEVTSLSEDTDEVLVFTYNANVVK